MFLGRVCEGCVFAGSSKEVPENRPPVRRGRGEEGGGLSAVCVCVCVCGSAPIAIPSCLTEKFLVIFLCCVGGPDCWVELSCPYVGPMTFLPSLDVSCRVVWISY